MTIKTQRFLGVLTDSSDLDGVFNDTTINTENTPILPCRGLVAFPYVSIPIPIGRESSLHLMEKAVKENLAVALIAQRNPDDENPTRISQLYRTGVLARIFKVIELPDGSKTAFAVAGPKLTLDKLVGRSPYLRGVVTLHKMTEMPQNSEMEALYDRLRTKYKEFLDLFGENETQEIRYALGPMNDPVKAISFIALNMPGGFKERQALLETEDWKDFLMKMLKMLNKAIQEVEISKEIEQLTKEELTQQQREHFLQQQIRTIQQELGQTDSDDIEKLRLRSAEKNWDWEQVETFEKEIKKLERFNPSTPDYAIQYNYLDTMLNLPWKNIADENFSLEEVEKVLDRDHFGLDKVKERIVEQMAVLKLRSDMKAPILCLFGPPGVGKTSLGKSIADALGREYCRVSLGGLHDEAEIRGHRKTYIGAMPGRIIGALAKCKTNNPVFVLDEIDKIGKDFKGDPSTALLEVLDPEQNNKFHDNYLDEDYDLSRVLFIATANDLGTISRPLRDRMEIIDIAGYVVEEKIEIALRHLIRKSLENHGMADKNISFTPDAVREIIEGYTRESGVRQLEKKISKVLRKVARLVASGKEIPEVITREMIKDYLGEREIFSDEYENNDTPGVVTGLAWTQTGGEILFIESSLSKGKGEKLTLTGNLGDVMKESAILALQYLKANAQSLGINEEDFTKYDVHVHVPEGAVPKDGPSAGITMATSLASSFTGRKVRERLAMTGEITLRGRVLPVGGIQEKILAAKRAGITDIILSSRNKKDINEIKPEYVEGLTFHYVDNIREVLEFALL